MYSPYSGYGSRFPYSSAYSSPYSAPLASTTYGGYSRGAYGSGYSYPFASTSYGGLGGVYGGYGGYRPSTAYPGSISAATYTGGYSGYLGQRSYGSAIASPYLSGASYAAPLSSYTPPVTSFAPAASTYTQSYNAGYSAPISFDARSYGGYTPYSPFGGSNYLGGFGAYPYSAYRGLEQPLELPTLALPAPPASTYFGATSLPAVNYGVPLPTESFGGQGTIIDVAAPADAPVAPPVEAEAAVVEEVAPPQEEGYVEAEPVVPETRNPWAPAPGEEEFDLEYSRQIAARRVIGEEEE